MTQLIPAAAIAQNTIALGKTRSGKSSKMRLIVEELLGQNNPVCILDPKGDWWGIKSSADGKRAGYPLIIFGGEHADIPINEHAGAHIAELIATGNRPCLIDLGGWMVAARTRFFLDFASTLFKLTKGARTLVIDECHNFAPKGRLFDPEAAKMLHWANRLASEGSGKGLTLLSASQRPQKVHNDYLTSHETLIACRVIHKADRDALKDWIDGCADPAVGKEMVASLADMQRKEAWVWSPEISFGPKRLIFPMFKTYDSFKPQGADAPATLKGWASVDLDGVRVQLAKVVEEAKENDPAALKLLVAQLRAELAKKAPAGPIVKVEINPKALAAAQEEGARAITFRMPEILDAQHKASFAAGMMWHGIAVAEMLRRISGPDPLPERKTLAGVMSILKEKLVLPDQRPASVATVITGTPKPLPTSRPPIVLDPKQGPIDPNLGRAKQKILDVMAWWESIGRVQADKDTIAFLAGVSPRSSGHQNNMGALRTAGLIDYPAPRMAGLTPEGRAAARLPSAPLNTEALQAAILAKLNTPLRAILEFLIGNPSHIFTKQDLAEHLGVSANSSGHQNNLGRLRSLGFIVYPQPGTVQVSPSLFI